MTIRQFAAVALVSAATSVGSIWGYGEFRQHQLVAGQNSRSSSGSNTASYADFNENVLSGPMVDFEKAASKAAPAVVHIRTRIKPKQVSNNSDNNPFREFFGDDFGDPFGGRGNGFQSPE